MLAIIFRLADDELEVVVVGVVAGPTFLGPDPGAGGSD